MLYYNFIFILCVVVFIISNFDLRSKYVFLLLGILVMVSMVLSSFRFGVGTDFESYTEIFDTCNSLSDISFKDSIIEPGYLVLNSFVKSIGGGFPFVAFLSSVLIFRNIFSAFKKFNVPYALGVVVYICLFFLSHQLNIIRQGIACSFIWIGFSYIQGRRFKPFILCLILGASFHAVSLLFIPFYWLLRVRLGLVTILSIIIASLIIGFKFDIFRSVLGVVFSGNAKYQYYTEVYFQNVNSDGNYGLSLGTMFNIFWLMIIYNRRFFSLNDNNLVLANALFWGIISIILLNKNAVFAERIGGVLYFSLIFIVPQFFKMYRRAIDFRIFGSIVVILYLGLYYYKTLGSIEYTGDYQYVPYKSILGNK